MIRKKPGSSWQNLLTHICNSQPDYLEDMECKKASSIGSIVRYVNANSQNVFGWLKFVIGKGVPFHWCDKF